MLGGIFKNPCYVHYKSLVSPIEQDMLNILYCARIKWLAFIGIHENVSLSLDIMGLFSSVLCPLILLGMRG